jgi:hypothetical protein
MYKKERGLIIYDNMSTRIHKNLNRYHVDSFTIGSRYVSRFAIYWLLILFLQIIQASLTSHLNECA